MRLFVPLFLILTALGFADDGQRLLRVDNYVKVRSTVVTVQVV